MKKLLVLSAAMIASGLALAQEVGRVISATPIIEQVSVPRNVCTTEQVAYNVVYEFAGKQYSVQMPNDPGPTLQLQISPVGANPPMTDLQRSATDQPPVYVQPARVMAAPPVYPGYYGRPYYPAVGLEVDIGSGDGHRGRRHWQ